MVQLSAESHSIFISARNKDITHSLLTHYNYTFITRGSGGQSFAGKIFYTLKASVLLTYQCHKYNPDLLISFASPYLSLASLFTGIPHISLDDTENDAFTWRVYSPFAHHIITPASFPLKSSKKQIRFPGNFELAYLHPNWFNPDHSILDRLELLPDDSYVIVRFVSHTATHDLFTKKHSYLSKVDFVGELSKFGKVFISSEIPLEIELEPFRFPLSPVEMHHAMAFASLVIGESATMASEAAVLGIPSVFFDPVGRCYTREEEEKYGLVFRIDCTPEGIEKGLNKAIELLTTPGIKESWQIKRKNILDNSIDVTEFLVWFIENYPDSARIMRENPDYQYRFR